MTRIGFKRFQPICLSIFGNVPGCCRPQHTAGLWWNGNMLESKVDYSLWTIFPAWMCCRPLFQCGRQVSISVRISKFPCAGPYSQVHTLAETAGFPGFKDQKVSYTSHDPHRYGDFRLFPTEMKVSLAACCCPASWLLLSDFTALSGSIDAFTDSLSRGLARHSYRGGNKTKCRGNPCNLRS